ncbi:MAG TPA: AsmA family protein, partial [Alphaproteobacteria bacterium]|nr:AsmA family protein [Alphaproteobacteria bacterium]
MRLKVVLTGIALIVLALLALAFTIVKATDFNQYRDYVAGRMKAATGRDLVIAGDVNVSFSLSPRLTARDVSFRNAAWSDQPQMARLGEIEAEVDLLSLLTGEIRIKDVVLRGGQVGVETNKDGVGNWVLDLAPATTPTPVDSTTTASGLPRVDQVAIEDVALLYRDGPNGSLVLVGVMYTAPASLSLEELDRRIPLSIARWHQHTNICLPPRDADQAAAIAGRHPEFGPRGRIATEAACEAAGGRWKRRVFNWMVHANVFEDRARVWADEHGG